MRIPSLMIGLFLGIILSFITSGFEELLATHIEFAFFIPFVVYMAAAVGGQTQTIYARDLKSGHASFKKYFAKETFLGIILGIIASLAIGIIITVWFRSYTLALAVSMATFGAIACAPLIALLVTHFFKLEHSDPAVGAGPIATVIQDTVSVLIYGLIASWIVL
ncbi:magnesium transporter [Candidatus Roizmanbacteria bacterium]|nr:magnesium transporter [Candidatus Roizmanbacteria bacterium]